jgi:hypothetical protein
MQNIMKLFRLKNKIQVFTVANGDLYHAYLEKTVIIIRERLRRIASGCVEMSGDRLSAIDLAHYVNKAIICPISEEIL